MVEPVPQSVYPNHKKLTQERLVFSVMSSVDQTDFIQRVEALVAAAKEAARNVKTDRAKQNLRNVVKFWTEFLTDAIEEKRLSLAVVAKSVKASSVRLQRKAGVWPDSSWMSDFVEQLRDLISHPLSAKKKVEPRSARPTIPLTPEFRAIYDEASGLIGSTLCAGSL